MDKSDELKSATSTKDDEKEQKDKEIDQEDSAEGKIAKKDEEEKLKIHFHCDSCEMDEYCHYFGKQPDFVNKITFLEDSYVMKDPFSPPPSSRGKSKPEYFLVLGSHCSVCKKIVCKSPECSFFYMRTFCLNCARNLTKRFPVEVQSKFKKQLAAIE